MGWFQKSIYILISWQNKSDWNLPLYFYAHFSPIVKKSVNSKQLHFILCLFLVSFVIAASFEKCINYLLSFFENIVARFAPDAQRYVTNYETKIKIQTNVQNRHSLLERCHRCGYFKSC